MSQCRNTCHPPHKTTSYRPTRLIDVRLGLDSDPCLVVSAEVVQDSVKYAALSYCWGSKEEASTQLKTESSNLKSRLKAIPIDIMPHAMTDAVIACRALSIPYIWIDALCIIQDDSDDWERESQCMGLVYEGAFVTLCALSSSSCHEGFLDRSPRHKIDVSFQSTLDPNIQGTYTMIQRGAKLTSDEYIYEPLQEDLQLSTWEKRAWTFQEMELSTRLIFFGENMLHYRCGMQELSENGFQRRIEGDEPLTLSDIFKTMVEERKSSRVSYGVFYDYAADYNARQLTFESDRLPALSGLAKLIQDQTGDKYLAGLWEKDLHHGLLWYANPSQSTLRECVENFGDPTSCIPTWSWASRQGFFERRVGGFYLSQERHVRPEFDLISASTAVKGLGPFGSVTGGEIKLSGCLVPVPSALILSNQTFWQTQLWWVCSGPDPVYAAHLSLDWDVPAEDLPLGISQRYPVSGLFMLLISSSCRGEASDMWGIAENEDDDEAEMGWTEKHSPVESSEVESGDEGWSVASKGNPAGCEQCAQPDFNRHAWGLVVYPAKQAGQYYRCGLFTSRARGAGGTKLFANTGYAEVRLI
ncbi:hypothetical protein jhhlp_007767 [Lomentospora prolificans]|uniref:Heterokaryon incompatibility domain-containing protein n=1 Tax=Lomentospora prolificans TaxID=41688 RepID=A0A2N3N0I0_9PEZI|nr:hypothetical protein jhhlp_007767 [Lomentospora prolificans]